MRLALIALLALAAACVDSTLAPTGLPSRDITTTVTDTQEFTWAEGHGPTYMGGTPQRVCFLTHVAGDFASSTEYVRTFQSGGSWWLSGNSNTSGVNARARCVPATAYSSEYTSVATAGGHTYLPMSGLACGLTRVGGQFKSWKDMAVITQAISTRTAWSFQTQTDALGYVQARARCITSNGFYLGDKFWHAKYPTVTLSTTSGVSCFLTGMSGDFNSATYWVRVYRSSGTWYLNGSSQKDTGGGYGACVKTYFFGTSP
jgi:hypothetical protein